MLHICDLYFIINLIPKLNRTFFMEKKSGKGINGNYVT